MSHMQWDLSDVKVMDKGTFSHVDFICTGITFYLEFSSLECV